jgi:hypothetical protein
MVSLVCPKGTTGQAAARATDAAAPGLISDPPELKSGGRRRRTPDFTNFQAFPPLWIRKTFPAHSLALSATFGACGFSKYAVAFRCHQPYITGFEYKLDH